MLLIDGCDILTPDAPRSRRENQSILIDDNRIVAIGPAGFERSASWEGSEGSASSEGSEGSKRSKPYEPYKPSEPYEPSQPYELSNLQTLDARGLLAIPGLINAHTHTPENYMRGATQCMPLEPWLVWLYALCGEYTPRDHYLCSALSAIEMLQSGCTATLDHFWHGGPWNREVLDAGMQANKDAGIRATLAPMYDDHDYVLDAADALGIDLRGSVYGMAHGGYRLDRDDFRRGILKDNLVLFDEWMRDWHMSENGRLQCFLGPAAGQLVTTDCLQRSFELARKYGAGVHMHCVETRVQDYCIRQTHSKSIIHWLYDEDLLAPDFTLPHSVWIRSIEDLDRLAEKGAIPVHNPAANLKLGSGLMAMREMLQRNITVALGVDGACSSDNQSMWDAIKLAALVHNLKDIDPASWVTAREAFEIGTQGGAAALLMHGQLGQLKVGQLADIALLDMRNPVLAPMNDAYGMLVHCETGSSVKHVVVNGDLVVKDKQLLTINVDDIIGEFSERVQHLPFRQPVDTATQKDIDDCYSFWWAIMKREEIRN